MTSVPGPEFAALQAFAPDPAPSIRRFDVRVARPHAARLLLEYELVGDLTALRLPPSGPAQQPTEGLWRHTCMEVFVSPVLPGAYLEFNLAPSGQWAAYRFSGYRAGMAPIAGNPAPHIEIRTLPDRLLLSAQVELPGEFAQGTLHLGLSAVVENVHGDLSYWAMRHAAQRPDFHHRDSFVFEI